MKKLVLLIFTSLTLFTHAQVEQWRGPDRNGIYPETNLLNQWPADGPELLWVLKDIPAGHSQVTIANETLFFTGLSDTMDVLIAADMEIGRASCRERV